ncbi:MAG TPA: flavodoxin family protein [Tenuifilaceae bacterium]|nr:flavodoxin family protein [Tenuifilaceae bacterium]HPQ35410.1 flavodoxin family protein [Tenuifilaceae bacterium]
MLIGSPRKNGNTSTMSKMLARNLGNGKLSTFFLYDYQISPCTDCRKCKKGDLVCTVSDDLDEIYKRIESADVIVFGTPIYWYGPTAKMKLLIDRLRPYFQNKKLNGKKAALLLPAGDGEKDCDLTIEMFKRIFRTLGVEYLGVVTSCAYDIGDAINDANLEEYLKSLSTKIIAGI